MRYFLDISYKGTEYHGWQIQENAKSVQEVLEQALQTLLRHEVHTLGSGRTDAGVHARQQYVQFDSTLVLTAKNILNLNGILPKDIVVNNIYRVPDHASARFDAQSRSYEYHINAKPNPFKLETSYYFPRNVDLEMMNRAAGLLFNHYDFQCFSKSNTEVEHYLCDITHAQFKAYGTDLIFYITANRFLRGMVRAVVGTLLEVGTNKISIEQFEQIVLSKDRKKAGRAVPPEGLYLCDIKYNIPLVSVA